MPNDLGLYDPLFYAQEGLIQLEKALGMARTVHRGFDKNPQQKGSTIAIRRPGTFTVQNAPSVAQDLNPDEVYVVLDQWKEVKFKLSDKELAYTTEQIIREHVRPAVYKLAEHIDGALTALYRYIPYASDITATITSPLAEISKGKTALWNRGVPMDVGDLFFSIDGSLQSTFESSAEFAQWQGAGDEGVRLQMRGGIGQKLGFSLYANQNIPTHTSGTVVSAGTDVLGAVNGAHTAGSTSLAINGLSLVETLKAGDSFSIAGITKRFVIAADGTLAAGAGTFTISPALPIALAGGEVVTFEDGTVAGNHAESFSANLMYHRNFAALAMAPLPEIGNRLGAQIASVADPITGLALRSRMYYVGDSSEVHVAFDVLFGVAVLDEQMAQVMRRTP